MKTVACFFVGHNYSAAKTTKTVQNSGPWFSDERTDLEVVTTEITNVIRANSPTPVMALVHVVETMTVGDRVCSRCGGTVRG
jgi:hypothetical protein